MEQVRQHEQDRAWVGAALADALDSGSPILRSFKAGDLPALQEIVDGLLADLEGNHPDREILLIAAVYLMLGDLLLKTDPETSDRAAVVTACRELGCLGARLVKSQPQTMRGARALMEAREVDSRLAFAHGPAEKFLALALGALSENSLIWGNGT